MKRSNTEERVDDRKKVLLEDERTDSVKRKSENYGGKRKKKPKLILPIPGRDRPLIWED